ncbi:MAG: hypothetical protein AAFO04_22285 [Cyanobacteria bacterium J06592_8]
MSETNPIPQLNLLVPWDLPTEYSLDETEQTQVTQALNYFLKALNQSSVENALTLIHLALQTIEPVDTTPAQIPQTKASLKTWEVEDYDRYFQVNHVQSQQSALCLVQSVLVSGQKFLILCSQSQTQKDFPNLDSKQIEQQKQGLISYAQLLARVFNINLDNQDE